MARPNEMIQNPLTGDKIIFLKTAQDTNGELLQMDVIVKPRVPGWFNDDHIHPRQTESLQIITGQMVYRMNGEYQLVNPGETIAVPAAVPHYLYNGSIDEAHFIWEFRPALKTEHLLETVFALANRGEFMPRGRLKFWQAIAIAAEYRDEERSASVPWFLQRILLAVLAPLAQSRGYSGQYDVKER